MVTDGRPDVGIDAGQSTIRLLVGDEGTARTTPGLSHPVTGSEVADRVASALTDRIATGLGRVVVGTTTLPADESERTALATLLRAHLGATEVWVTGDETAAHAGAFDGHPGVVLVVGTGVACLAADPARGVARTLDGGGYLLGDEGGAFWIGRHAIRAALAAREGRGPRTVLGDLIGERFDGLDGLAPRLHADPAAVDRIARAAVDALAAAADGDEVGVGLVDAAADRLTTTVVAALASLADGVPVALDGRLLDGDSPLTVRLLDRLRTELGADHPIERRPGSGLAGALRLASAPVEASPYRRWTTPAAARSTGPDPAAAERTGSERTGSATAPAATRSIDAARAVLAEIGSDELGAIGRAAALLADTIAADGLVHVFGTGHSHLLAEELFYRAGGLAAIDPILVPSLMLHEGAIRSTELERTPGLTDEILADVTLSPADALVVVSNSGGNVVTHELAERCRDVGMTVVAIVSRRHAATKPTARLIALADVVIDNHGIAGDAAVTIDGVEPRVGPTSTVAGAAIVQALVAATVEELVTRGVEPEILRSANAPGGDAHNERVLARRRTRIRSL